MAMLTRGGLTLALPGRKPEPQRVPDHPGSPHRWHRTISRPSVRPSGHPGVGNVANRASSEEGTAHHR